MSEPMKWDMKFDVGEDGRVQFRMCELPSWTLVVSMDLPPDEADRMGDALKQQAARARRMQGEPT
jgi:hypothetical protein